MVRRRDKEGGVIRKEYRVIDYQKNWYLEELESAGVWKILHTFDNKEDAIKKLKEVENGKEN